MLFVASADVKAATPCSMLRLPYTSTHSPRASTHTHARRARRARCARRARAREPFVALRVLGAGIPRTNGSHNTESEQGTLAELARLCRAYRATAQAPDRLAESPRPQLSTPLGHSEEEQVRHLELERAKLLDWISILEVDLGNLASELATSEQQLESAKHCEFELRQCEIKLKERILMVEDELATQTELAASLQAQVWLLEKANMEAQALSSEKSQVWLSSFFYSAHPCELMPALWPAQRAHPVEQYQSGAVPTGADHKASNI